MAIAVFTMACAVITAGIIAGSGIATTTGVRIACAGSFGTITAATLFAAGGGDRLGLAARGLGFASETV